MSADYYDASYLAHADDVAAIAETIAEDNGDVPAEHIIMVVLPEVVIEPPLDWSYVNGDS